MLAVLWKVEERERLWLNCLSINGRSKSKEAAFYDRQLSAGSQVRSDLLPKASTASLTAPAASSRRHIISDRLLAAT